MNKKVIIGIVLSLICISGIALARTDYGTTTILKGLSAYLFEQSDAQRDIVGYGQLWVNSGDDPGTLWFTHEDGTNKRLDAIYVEDGSSATLTWTIPLSGANDPTITFSDGLISFGANIATVATSTPSLCMDDQDSASETDDACIYAQATDLDDGQEDVDVTFKTQIASSLVEYLSVDADITGGAGGGVPLVKLGGAHTGTIEIGSASATELTLQTDAMTVTEADLAIIADSSIVTGEITDGTILEIDLDVDEADPTDGDILTFDDTGNNFSWQTLAELGIVTDASPVTDLEGDGLSITDGTLDADIYSGCSDCIADGEVPNTITINLATLATTVTITDNEAQTEENPVWFSAGASGSGATGAEVDGDLAYNPNAGTLTAPEFVGGGANLTGIVTGGIANDTILEIDLDADNEATNNDILTFDDTGNDFSWQTPTELGLLTSEVNNLETVATDIEDTEIPIGSTSNDVIYTAIPVCPTDETIVFADDAPNTLTCTEIDLVLASSHFENQGSTTTVLHGNAAGNPAFGAIVTGDIDDDTILEIDLDADNEATNNDILTFDDTGNDFSWQTLAELLIQPLDTELTLLGGLAETRGNIIVGDAGGEWEAVALGGANDVFMAGADDPAWVAEPAIDCTNCTDIPAAADLDDVTNVSLTAPADGDVLCFTGAANASVNCTVGGALASATEDAGVLTVVANTTQIINTINPSAALTVGDGGDTLELKSSDWAIDVAGVITGVGNITSDGTVSAIDFAITGITGGIEITNNFPTECVMLDATGGNCLGTGGCTTETIVGGTHDYRTMNFATGADSAATWAFELPDNMIGTTAAVTFVWHSDHTDCDENDADDVCWQIDGDSFADDGAWEAGTLAGTVNGANDICILDGDIMYSAPVTFTHSMVKSQRAIVKVFRDVAGTPTGCASEDDYTQDAKLLAVRFCYDVDDVFSGE